MGLLTSIPFLGDLLSKVTDKIAPDKSKILEGQSKINELEIAGAPTSKLRLWRSLLGCLLVFAIAWELIGRPIITTYWPEATLPPSMLKEIMHILLGMLGLGF